MRGSTSNHPFRPGGFDLPQSSGKTIPIGALNGDWLREVFHGGPLQKVAPGLKHGIDFGLPEVSDLTLSKALCTNRGHASPYRKEHRAFSRDFFTDFLLENDN